MNLFKVPLLNPFKFVPLNGTGIHFDDRLQCQHLKHFEIKKRYTQKWVKTDLSSVQVTLSFEPPDMQLIDREGNMIKSFFWSRPFVGLTYSIYECLIDVADVPDGIYFLYCPAELLGISWPILSEPIEIASYHPNTLLFRYYNDVNKEDVAFTTRIQFQFRCEASIQDFTPQNDKNEYVNQRSDTKVLNANPSRMFQLYIGDTRYNISGVADWVVDLMNRIFGCSNKYIEEKAYTNKAGSDFRVTRVRGYPLVGASLDIVPSVTETSLEFANDAATVNGLVTAFNIQTGFFGPGARVPVIKIDQNG